MAEIKLNFKWKENKGLYASGELLYINKIRIASYSYNIARTRGEEGTDYSGQVNLPSLTNNRVYAPNTEQIKKQIEATVTAWFKEALREG